MFLLLKNATLYAPEPRGLSDTLVAAGTVLAILPAAQGPDRDGSRRGFRRSG